jgi:hypothetical protein
LSTADMVVSLEEEQSDVEFSVSVGIGASDASHEVVVDEDHSAEIRVGLVSAVEDDVTERSQEMVV